MLLVGDQRLWLWWWVDPLLAPGSLPLIVVPPFVAHSAWLLAHSYNMPTVALGLVVPRLVAGRFRWFLVSQVDWELWHSEKGVGVVWC